RFEGGSGGMNALNVASLILLALSAAGVVLLAGTVPVPPGPRLGRRGAERRRALETEGLFALTEPLVRFVAGLFARLPIERLRRHQDRALRQADYPLGLSPDEYSALSVLSALALGGVG